MAEITLAKAQKIFTALKGIDQKLNGSDAIEWTVNIFINHQGEIIFLYNSFNFKTVGKILDEKRFQIGRLQFDF